MIDVMKELTELWAETKSAPYCVKLKGVERIWESIPEPKIENLNAYWLIRSAVTIALKAGDLETASKWANLAPPFAKHRHDLGEVEFLLGEVAFARGETEIAKQNFMIAKKKSLGRLLRNADPKYKALIK